MFNSMRKLGSGLLAKVLVVLISIAFGLWGVSDVLRSGGPSYAAKVGGEKISVAEFQHQKTLLARQMEAMGVQGMGNVMDTAVLRQMIQQQLLLQTLDELGLYVNEKLLAQKVQEEPEFTGKDGHFDADKFKATLANARLSEATFLEQLKGETGAKFLLASMDVSDITPPAPVMDLAATAASETRDVTLVTIPAHVPADKITAAAMQEYYDTHKALQYLMPPSRTIEYVLLAPGQYEALLDKAITDDMRTQAAKDDPSASKEKIEAQLRSDARETVSRDVSNGVQDALAGGSTLGGAMEKLGIKAQSHLLENVTEETAKTVSDEAEKTALTQGLALGDGGVSGLITTPHGAALMVAIKSINPAAPKPFKDVEADVRTKLGQQLAREDARARAQEVKAALMKSTDAQAALKPFSLLGQKVVNIPRPVEGKPELNHIPPTLQQAIFERAPGEVAGPLALPDGGQMIALVTQVHYPKPAADAKRDAATAKQLAEGLNQDVQGNAFNAFAAKHRVQVNPQLFKQAADPAP